MISIVLMMMLFIKPKSNISAALNTVFIKIRKSFLFFGFIVLLFSTSCDTDVLYENNIRLDSESWNQENKLEFDVNIQDTTLPYDFYLNLRHNNDYMYSNLFLFIDTYYPTYCVGPDTIKSLNGTFSDGSGPLNNYENNMSCSWLIDPQSIMDSVSFISLEFNRLNTEEGVDNISIYDGPTTNDPLLGVFSGTNIPQTINSTGNKVLVIFESDNESTSEGWFISYTSEIPDWCNGLLNLTEPIDTVEDGSGDFYYHNNATCMWYIQPEGATNITLTFMEFDTEQDEDLVKIYDAATNTLLETWSGSEIPPSITVETSKMMIAFTSSSANTHQGWKAWYTIDDVSVPKLSEVSDKLQIYPNPAQKVVHLEFEQSQNSESSYKIKSLTGKTIRENTIPAYSKSHSINLEGLSTGIYFIEVYNENWYSIRKVIINP